jgi:hypothetical protein
VEDDKDSSISVKDKSIKKKLILFFIIIIDIIFIIGIVIAAIKLWPNREKIENKNYDSIFLYLNVSKELLQNIDENCGNPNMETNNILVCASKVLAINGCLIESRSLCDKISGVYNILCLSFVEAQTNQTEGTKICNENLNSSLLRNICLFRILYSSKNSSVEDIFLYCDNIFDDNEKYGCLASFYAVQEKMNKASKYCNSIQDSNERNICIEVINQISPNYIFK